MKWKKKRPKDTLGAFQWLKNEGQGMKKALCAVVPFCTATAWGLWEPGIQRMLGELNACLIQSHPSLADAEKELSFAVANTWCSLEKAQMLFQLMAWKRPRVALDVGSFTGGSTIALTKAANAFGACSVHALDCWDSEILRRAMPDTNAVYSWWRSLDMTEIKKQFFKNIERSGIDVCVVEGDSANATSIFSQKFDLVHLDGDFTPEGSLRDVQLFDSLLSERGILVLGNACLLIDNNYVKSKSVQYLFDRYKFLGSADNDNTLFFEKL